jgi:hypothetical protein
MLEKSLAMVEVSRKLESFDSATTQYLILLIMSFQWTLAHLHSLVALLSTWDRTNYPWNKRGSMDDAYRQLARDINKDLLPFQRQNVVSSTLKTKLLDIKDLANRVLLKEVTKVKLTDLGIKSTGNFSL